MRFSGSWSRCVASTICLFTRSRCLLFLHAPNAMATNRLALCCTFDCTFLLVGAPKQKAVGYFLYFLKRLENKKKRKAKMRRWRGVVTGSRCPGALTSPARGHSALITLPLPAARPLGVAAGRQSIFLFASTTITRQQTPQRLAHMRCTFHTASSNAPTRVPLSSLLCCFNHLFYYFIIFMSFISFYFIRVLCSGLFLGTSLFLFFRSLVAISFIFIPNDAVAATHNGSSPTHRRPFLQGSYTSFFFVLKSERIAHDFVPHSSSGPSLSKWRA